MPVIPSLPSLFTRSQPLDSPLSSHYLLTRNAAPPSSTYHPGAGAFNPRDINNNGFFALFALLGVAMVLAAIWFFFIAKNGGFHFRKGDWDDYKSTVLRRKGPDGKTLSGATKTTVLGGGSVVGARDSDYDQYSDDRTQPEDMTEDGRSLAGTFAWAKKKVPPLRPKGLRGGGRATEQKPKGKKAQAQQQQKKAQREIPKSKQPRGSKNNHDADMRAYRHEKPAQVGGLNRQTDATYSHHDFAYSDNTYSEMSESNIHPTGYNPFRDSVASAATTTSPSPHTPDNNTNNKHKRFNTSAASKLYTHSPNDSSGSHRPLRPHNHTSSSPSRDSTPTRSGANRGDRRRSSPHKQDRGSSRAAGDYHPRRSNPPGSFTQTQYTEPLDFESRYSGKSKASDMGTEDSRGTKAYFHPIPGLGAGMGSAGHGYSAAAGGGGGGGAGGGGGGGFRRSYGVGGRGRRDSLSDSEGETGTAFS